MLKFKPDLLIFMTHNLILYSFMFNQARSHGVGETKGSLAPSISFAPKSFFFFFNLKLDKETSFYFFFFFFFGRKLHVNSSQIFTHKNMKN